MADLRGLSRHAATRTFIGTAVGYGLILVVMTALLFVLPYFVFRMV